MTESPSVAAQRLLVQAADAVLAAAPASDDAELVALLATCESVVRRLDRATVDAVAALGRRGVFAAKGYRSAVQALGDLLGWERFEARRRVVAAEGVAPRTGLDGGVLPARLPATAEVFAAGRAGLRHVEVIARVLDGKAAARLSPEQWAGAEAQLAAKADTYTPGELHAWGTGLVELLDQDGEAPDDRPPALDVGRATRTVPDGLRRAVAARDRGCAHPGCGRPMSWAEVHHVREWEFGGETRLDNLVALCRVHHRQIHSTDWVVRIRDGLPEFVPPRWVDPEQRARRRALPHLAAAG